MACPQSEVNPRVFGKFCICQFLVRKFLEKASWLLHLLEIVASEMVADRMEKNYSGRIITEEGGICFILPDLNEMSLLLPQLCDCTPIYD